MKSGIVNDRIHVLESNSDVWKIINGIAESGMQEEAFYVCDLGQIVNKFREWKMKLPRVEPHYGWFCFEMKCLWDLMDKR